MPYKCQGEQDGIEEPDVSQALAEKTSTRQIRLRIPAS
jgi:hypothetical protein